ncbi:hypothetical protein D3C86_1680640 [compost metagenome]
MDRFSFCKVEVKTHKVVLRIPQFKDYVLPVSDINNKGAQLFIDLEYITVSRMHLVRNSDTVSFNIAIQLSSQICYPIQFYAILMNDFLHLRFRLRLCTTKLTFRQI